MKNKYKASVFRDAAIVSHLSYQIGESNLLRNPSKEIDFKKIKSKEVRKVILDLKKRLREFRKLTGRGKGIAAVQAGIPLCIAVLYIGKKIITIINPVISGQSKEIYYYPEICMSANPIIAKVARPKWVTVEYLDENGNFKIWNDKKNFVLNRVFQHEIDHMRGVINIDLVASKDLILDSDKDFFKNAKAEKLTE